MAFGNASLSDYTPKLLSQKLCTRSCKFHEVAEYKLNYSWNNSLDYVVVAIRGVIFKVNRSQEWCDSTVLIRD